MNCFLGREHVVLGDLNADIGRLMNPLDHQVTDLLASFGLVYILARFCQRLRYRNLQTWWDVCQG